jgi:pilus assembly protein CpaB
MNRKFILLFSLLIIAIGTTGILMNSKDDDNTLADAATLNQEKEVTIMLAQAAHDLSSGSILTKQDYTLKTVMVPESSELIKSDVSNVEHINSHLLKYNVIAGSYITQHMLISRDSDEFIRLHLQKGEIIYRFNIKPQDEYLLDTLSVNDTLSFQLRTLETDKRTGMENGIAIDTNQMNDRKNQSYSLTNIIPNMRIIRIKKHSAGELSEKNSKNQKTESQITGFIEVIIKTEQLDTIHIAEKVGDVFLVPGIQLHDENNKSKNLHDILPKLHTIRELRG